MKKREAFRPFAPAVLDEVALEYFDLPGAQTMPFMTFTTSVRPDKRPLLGAITHVRMAPRACKTVSRESNERFWKLIRAFGDRTGVPVLLNTSFNNNVEPIVESVRDAIACFLTTGLNYLVVGDVLVEKKVVSPLAHLEMVVSLPLHCVSLAGVRARTRGAGASLRGGHRSRR